MCCKRPLFSAPRITFCSLAGTLMPHWFFVPQNICFTVPYGYGNNIMVPPPSYALEHHPGYDQPPPDYHAVNTLSSGTPMYAASVNELDAAESQRSVSQMEAPFGDEERETKVMEAGLSTHGTVLANQDADNDNDTQSTPSGRLPPINPSRADFNSSMVNFLPNYEDHQDNQKKNSFQSVSLESPMPQTTTVQRDDGQQQAEVPTFFVHAPIDGIPHTTDSIGSNAPLSDSVHAQGVQDVSNKPTTAESARRESHASVNSHEEVPEANQSITVGHEILHDIDDLNTDNNDAGHVEVENIMKDENIDTPGAHEPAFETAPITTEQEHPTEVNSNESHEKDPETTGHAVVDETIVPEPSLEIHEGEEGQSVKFDFTGTSDTNNEKHDEW